MPNVIKAILVFILLVMVLFYVPTYDTYSKQEDLIRLNTRQAVTDFVDNVRYKGYITPKMYEDFQLKIGIADVIFDIDVEHQHKVYNPIYTDPADTNTFTGDYTVDYDSFYWDGISSKLYDVQLPIEDRTYKLEKGDYFKVTIENKSKLKSTILFGFLSNSIDESSPEIYVNYGGMILNEDY